MKRFPFAGNDHGRMQNPLPFYKFLDFDMLNHQHAMRNFLDAALRENDKDTVVLKLSEDKGPKLLTQLLNIPFDIDAHENSRERVSFQAVALKLCKLLSHPQVRRSAQATARGKMFQLVGQNTSFFNVCTLCFERLVYKKVGSQTSRFGRGAQLSQVSDEALFDFLLVIETCLNECPSICFLSWWENTISKLRIVFDALVNSGRISFANEISRSLAHISDMTGTTGRTDDLNVDWCDFAKIHGPGTRRSGGPRHDNDFENFREMDIYPTLQEILCEEPPYLPLQTGPNGKHSSAWLASDTEINLDIQFRLIREDLTRTFRLGVKNFIEGAAMDTITEGLATFDLDDGFSTSGQFFVWTKVDFKGLDLHFRRDTSFKYRVVNPGSLHFQSDVSVEQAAIMGDRLFQFSSIVCVVIKNQKRLGETDSQSNEAENNATKQVVGGKQASCSKAIWCHVTSTEGKADETDSIELEKEISLAPVRSEDFETLLRLTPKPHLRCGPDLYILQLKGHFACAHEETLECLKTLPLSVIPFGPRISRREIVSSEAHSNSQERHIASYIKANVMYDISMLSDDPETKRVLNGVHAANPKELERLLRREENRISLEGTQVDAFVRGLTEEVALIQGPPGCGKTYIGVKIVGALLKNRAMISALTASDEKENLNYSRSERTPILCVCYTNHALDQFLESLLSTGCVNLQDFVRIGSRSDSDIIKTRTLPTVLRAPPYQQKCPSSFFKCAILAEELMSWNKSLSNSVCEHFILWLGEHHPAFLREVVDDGDSEQSAGDCCAMYDYDSYIQTWLSTDEPSLSEARSRKYYDVQRAFGEYAVSKVQSMKKELVEAKKRQKEDETAVQLKVLQDMKIVGCTTSGAARYRNLLQALGSTIVVCEEAAEVNEGQLLTTLSSSCKQFILIGDHLQLPPKTDEYTLTSASGKGHGLDISLFERLSRDRVVPHITLSTQRRMHPKIADLARLDTYPLLTDADAVHQYPDHPRGFSTPTFFLDHDEEESNSEDEGGKTKSLTNQFEIDLITALTKYVIGQGHSPDQIAVLTPYRAQLKEIKNRFESEEVMAVVTERDEREMELDEISDLHFTEPNQNVPADDRVVAKQKTTASTEEIAVHRKMTDCVRLATVDKFQGEEADIVLISTVRSNMNGTIGFMSSSNRTNVMLTRARLGMYIVGSAGTILDTTDTLLKKTVQHLMCNGSVGRCLPLKCQTHGVVTTVSHPTDFHDDHGCGGECNMLLPCSHRCQRKCHPPHEHAVLRCTQPCENVFSGCGHRCQKRCSDPCKTCEKPVSISLPCGHTTLQPCASVREGNHHNIQCIVVIEACRPRPCGHSSDFLCFEQTSRRTDCKDECGFELPCGHICGTICHYQRGQDVHKSKCHLDCGKVLQCGHVCSMKCHGTTQCNTCKCFCLLPEYQTFSTKTKCRDVFYDCHNGTWASLCQCGAHSNCVDSKLTCNQSPCTFDCAGRRAFTLNRNMQEEIRAHNERLEKTRKSLEKMLVRHSRMDRPRRHISATGRSSRDLDVRNIFTSALVLTEDVKQTLRHISSSGSVLKRQFQGQKKVLFDSFVVQHLVDVKRLQLLLALLRARTHCRKAARDSVDNVKQSDLDEDKRRIIEVEEFIQYFRSNLGAVMVGSSHGSEESNDIFAMSACEGLSNLQKDLKDVGAGREDLAYDTETLAKLCFDEYAKVSSILRSRTSSPSNTGNGGASLNHRLEKLQLGQGRRAWNRR